MLTGILTDSDPPDPGKGSACPAPAVLWALVEDIPPEGSPLIAGLREHVAQCSRCAELARRFQGFENLEKSAAPQPMPTAEAAWAAAAPRLSLRIEQALDRRAECMQARRRQASFWSKWSWLPSFQVSRFAYAGAGFALVAVATVASIAYFGRTEPDPGVLQSQTASATVEESASAPQEPESASIPAEDPGRTAPANAQMPSDSISPSVGKAIDKTLARGPAAAAGAGSNASADAMLLLAGQTVRVTIAHAQPAEGGVRIQGELAPLGQGEGKAAESAFFSALAPVRPGPVKLSIRSFRLNGKDFPVQNGDSMGISVSWPAESGSPSAGQSFEMRIVSGGVLRSGTSQK